MKKIKIFSLGVAVVIAGLLASCAGTHEKEDKNVANKIESNEVLTDADYTLIIKYVGDYAEKAQQYVDDQINGTNAEEAQQSLVKLGEEYPYLELYRNCLKNTQLDQLSAENQELVAKYAGLIEFTAPQGTTIQTNPIPDQAGVEVEDTNNVVAPVE